MSHVTPPAKNIAKSSYDVVIVGAGPAGIFAALELIRQNGWSVLLVEKGFDMPKRKCPGPGSAAGRLRDRLQALLHHLRLGRRRRLQRRQADAFP